MIPDTLKQFLGSPEGQAINVIVTVFSASLSLVSTIIALISIRSGSDLQKASRETLIASRETIDLLKNFEKKLSTRHVGEFPEHIKPINQMLGRASKSITICCQAVGYGATTAVEDYTEYEYNLIKKSLANVNVQLLTPCQQEMEAARHHQFDRGKDWDKRICDPNFQKILQTLCGRLGRDAPINKYDDFINALKEENEKSRSALCNRVDIKDIPSLMPLQFWIVDGKEAVFAIKSGKSANVSNAFSTIDSQIVSSLSSICEYYLSLRDTAKTPLPVTGSKS